MTTFPGQVSLLYILGFTITCIYSDAFLLPRCGFSPSVNHAHRLYHGLSDPDGYNITFECYDGYHLVGPSDTIQCVCSGPSVSTCQFQGSLPVCKIDPACILLPRPPHGQVIYDGHVVANYSCNGGFVLVGQSTRHCDEYGQWDGKEPKCEPVVQCLKLPGPINGVVTYEGDSTIHYSCNRDHVLIGPATRYCDHLGLWSGEDPKCDPALRCRACDRVKHLDQCSRIITCNAGEECFTEHITNDITRLSVFTSGCRPKQNCSAPNVIPKGNDIVNCTGCCSDVNSTLGCNTELCSFREHSGSRSTHCLHCEREDSIDDCNNVTACDSSQMCVTSTVVDGSDRKVSAGCYSSITCLKLIKALVDPTLGLDRERNVIHTCDVCCGDEGCNTDTCENVKERLMYLYQQGELDLHTLKVNGTSTWF